MSNTKIIASQWSAVDAGEVLELDLGARSSLLIHHAIPHPSEVLVHGITEKGDRIPVRFLFGCGTTRLNLVGFRTAELIAESDCGIAVSLDNGEHFEEWDEAPPPEVKLPSNALARMRAAFRASLGMTREEFLTGDELLGYEVPDEATVMFEEEEAAATARARKAKAKESEGKDERKTEVARQDGNEHPSEQDAVAGSAAGDSAD